MFSQIQVEFEKLIVSMEKEIEYISALRQTETNPNMFTEYGGRTIGLTTALHEIQKTKLKINEHIVDILKNTTDGNYIKKLDVLKDENDILQEKIKILEDDLKRYNALKGKGADSPILKELSTEEVDDIIEKEYEKDSDLYTDYDEDDEE